MKLKKSVAALAATVMAGAVFAGGAVAATASGLAVGQLDGTEKRAQYYGADGVALVTTKDTTVRSFDLTYAADEVSQWHEHPGIVIAVVQSGSVTREQKCTGGAGDPFTVGDSFVEVGPHNVTAGPEGATLKITMIIPTKDAAATPPHTRDNVDPATLRVCK